MDDNEKIAEYFERADVIADIAQLAQSLHDEYMEDDEIVAAANDENGEGVMLLTIGAGVSDDDVDWSWQSGDNSYTGGAYSYPNWGVVWFSPEMTGKEYAKEIVDDLVNSLPW